MAQTEEFMFQMWPIDQLYIELGFKQAVNCVVNSLTEWSIMQHMFTLKLMMIFFLLSQTKGQTAAAAVQEIVLSTEHDGVKEIEILKEHLYCQSRKF